MSDTLLVYTGKLNAVYADYEDLHTTMAASSMPQPSGFERSNPAATSAAGVVGEGIANMVTAIGELAAGVWDVAQWYQDVDMCVTHDFSRYEA